MHPTNHIANVSFVFASFSRTSSKTFSSKPQLFARHMTAKCSRSLFFFFEMLSLVLLQANVRENF